MPDLATLASVKTYLGITDTASDALLSSLITAASQEFLNEIGRPLDFAAADYTERFCAWTTCKVYPKHYPINTVASITLDGVALPVWNPADPGTIGYVFDATEYPENKASILIRASCWPSTTFYSWRNDWRWNWVQNVVLTYNAGYATVPADVAQAIIEMVAVKRGVSQLQSATQSGTSLTLGDYSEGATTGNSSSSLLTDSRPTSIQSVIDLYTRPRI